MPSQTQPGRVIAGRYRLLKQLGAGGFGRVWKAHDIELGVDVAVKELWLPPSTSAAERAERLARARREVRTAARLRDHPNVVAIHDVVVEDEMPWTVMQLVSGASLADRLAAGGPLPVVHVATIAARVLTALQAVHEAGIVHRDIKPGNIMLAADGGVLLTDFGIAINDAATDTALTASGTVIGSVEYLAPERLRGDTATAASDLFSLGATLYQAVEGISPFKRDNPAAALSAVLLDEPPPPARAGALRPVIVGLLTKDPGQRTTGAAALAMLDRSRSAAPTPTAAVQQTGTRPRIRRGLGIGKSDLKFMVLPSFFAVAALVIVLGLTLAQHNRDQRDHQAWTKLDTSCGVVSGAILDSFQLSTDIESDRKDPGRWRQCQWLSKSGADTPYGRADVLLTAENGTDDPRPPGASEVLIAGDTHGWKYVDAAKPGTDNTQYACTVTWPVSFGFIRIRFGTAMYQPVSDDGVQLCHAAQQFADAVYPQPAELIGGGAAEPSPPADLSG